MAAGKKKLARLTRIKKIFTKTYCLFFFTSSPPPLHSIKETSIQTQARWFFGTLDPHFLRLLAFPAAASLASTPGLSVYWAAMCEQGELGSVNSTPRPLVHSKFTWIAKRVIIYWADTSNVCPSFCYCCSVTKSSPTLCDPMDCRTLGFPVFHYLLQFDQIHVHWVDDVIQPSHPLSPSSPFPFNLSQCQSLFQWVSSSHQVAKVSESFQWIFRTDFL